MRIATYNFLSGGSRSRNRHWQLLSEHVRPELLFTQECRPIDVGGTDQFLWAEAVPRGWGTGLYARGARLRSITIRPYKGWVTGAEIHEAPWLHGRAIVAFSIHCPAGDHGYIRTMHHILDKLKRFTKGASGADLVMGGDLNVVGGYRSADDKVKMSRGEKELLDRMCGEFDLLPCWQTANQGQPLSQTLRWSANRQTPYHCDGIFIPRSWQPQLTHCQVLDGPEWHQLSDHNPVVALLTPPQTSH
jgi:hypothetical protein